MHACIIMEQQPGHQRKERSDRNHGETNPPPPAAPLFVLHPPATALRGYTSSLSRHTKKKGTPTQTDRESEEARERGLVRAVAIKMANFEVNVESISTPTHKKGTPTQIGRARNVGGGGGRGKENLEIEKKMACASFCIEKKTPTQRQWQQTNEHRQFWIPQPFSTSYRVFVRRSV